jgi:hypothetical protein
VTKLNLKDVLNSSLSRTKLYIDTELAKKANSSHTHNYASSSSAGGAATSANKVNNNLIVKLNGGSTEGTNLFTFNGSAAKTINITPSSIGAAESSHGTHLTIGTGSGNAFRGDHGVIAYNHSQATHAPANAQKNSDITKAEIEAKLTGTITSHNHSGTYAPVTHGNHVPTTQTAQNNVFLRNDNTWQKVTPENIGAASASHGTHVTYGGNGSASTVSRSDHTHSYLPLGGGTMTGNITFTDVTSTTYPAVSNKLTWNGSTDGVDIYYQVDASDKGRLVLNTRDDADCIIAFANKGTVISTIDNSGNFSGKASTATKATQDSAGQQINTTYIKGLSVSGKTITYTKGDGTTGTITTQDTNTTYSVGTASALGLTKLYTNTGTATDGTMTQAAIKTALDGKAASSHGTHLTLGTGSGNAFRGDYGNTAYNHSQAAHAPSNAQKNSDITKAEIEAKLTGNITSHIHSAVNGLSFWTGTQSQYDGLSSKSNSTIYIIT